MPRKIDQRSGDSFRGVRTHGVAGYPYAGSINFRVEARDSFLQTTERIQKEGNVSRAAFPQRGILQHFAGGLMEAYILVAAAAPLRDGIVVDRLKRNVAVSCPGRCHSF